MWNPGQFFSHQDIKARQLKQRAEGRSFQQQMWNQLQHCKQRYPDENMQPYQKNNLAVLLFEFDEKNVAQKLIQEAWDQACSGPIGAVQLRELGGNLARICLMGYHDDRDNVNLEAPAQKPDIPEIDGPSAFIGATGNSGTTFLQQVLDRHPELNSFGETYLFGRKLLMNLCRFYADLGSEMKGHFLRELKIYLLTAWYTNPPVEHEEFQWGLDQFFDGDTIREGFAFLDPIRHTSNREEVESGVGDFIRYLFNTLTVEKGKQQWIEKTPKNMLSIDVLSSMFDDLHFVHIFRDPRDVVCSRYESKLKKPMISDPEQFDHVDRGWLNWFFNGFSRLGDVSFPGYTAISYEDFVQQPESTLGTLMDGLDLSVADEMLELEFRTSSVERYQEDLAEPGKVYMEKRFGEIIQLLGYPVDDTPLETPESVFYNRADTFSDLVSCLGGLLETIAHRERKSHDRVDAFAGESDLRAVLQEIMEQGDQLASFQQEALERMQQRVTNLDALL